ncbi:hypothetical protein Tph_c07950 [Thermacetogenium phaeum DSM 12270]|uniref:Uncharacterized protein n=1 Tax=Thermacetogenium phaeum (strain ATCC BAA-254 / DSM 26808 / PB) TaxID=1089553 RepID=K4LGC5_THEPS|nr:hypothetical protein Tph_c07950 [Thermacetogenium phaeum DSM 12270]
MEVRPYLLPVPPYGLGQPTGVEYSPIVKDAGTVDTVCRMCPPSPLTPCSPGSLAHCPCTPCSTFQGHKKTPGTFTCFARGFCYSLCYSLVTVLAENPRNYGGLTETNPALPLIYRTRKPLIFKAFHSIFGKLGKKRCHCIIDKNIKWLVWIFVLLFHYILGQIEHENLLPVQDDVPTST